MLGWGGSVVREVLCTENWEVQWVTVSKLSQPVSGRTEVWAYICLTLKTIFHWILTKRRKNLYLFSECFRLAVLYSHETIWATMRRKTIQPFWVGHNVLVSAKYSCTHHCWGVWREHCWAGAGWCIKSLPPLQMHHNAPFTPWDRDLDYNAGRVNPTCLFLSFLDKHKSNKEARKSVQVTSPRGKAGVAGRLS